MKGIVAIALIIAVAALGVACGGDGGNGSNGSNGPNGSTATGSDFEQLRDTLTSRLDGIGVNIGIVPDDVLGQILNQCHDLEEFADQQRVSDLCDAIRRARDTNDPGLLDQIVAELGQLRSD